MRTYTLTEYMYIITYFFDVTLYSIALTAGIAYLIYLVRGAKHAALFMLSILTTSVMVYALKIFFNVARPTDSVMSAFGQSFPSYHAAVSTVFFVMLMYIFDDYFNPFFRVVFNSFCCIGIFLVAFSRVYLGVHWLSDVVFGVLLGSAISYISILVFRHTRAAL